MFRDVLITCDFDRTLTAIDGSIPQRNLEAIHYFMENGGAFTINTGRGMAMFHKFLDRIPFNAPLILCNGSTAYDPWKREYLFTHTIPLDQETLIRELEALVPESIVEFQALERHYVFRENKLWKEFNRLNNCPDAYANHGDDLGPFIKLCIYENLDGATVSHLFQATPEQMAYFDNVERLVVERYGDSLTVLRVAPRIIDIHAKGVNKGSAARELQQKLGKKYLVCIGDEFNDLAMLQAADFAYSPADGRVAHLFENVCECGEGAVADVIYKKIPEILEKMP